MARAERTPTPGAPPQLHDASRARPDRHPDAARIGGIPRRPRRRGAARVAKPVVALLALLPVAYIVWAAATDPDALGANPINEVEHFTGEWALRFLGFTLALTPLRQLTGWGELARFRRMLGLFAFFYATVHLATWVGVDMELDTGDMWHDVVKHRYITVGMLGWLMLLPLAVTSTRGWIRRLGARRWRRLHRLTYAAAAAGVVHFFWAVKKDVTEPLLYAAAIGALLAWRAWGGLAKAGGRVKGDA